MHRTVTGPAVRADEWAHVGFTVDADRVKLWLNYRVVAETDMTVDASGDLRIGRYGESRFDGLFDTMVVFDRDITSDELEDASRLQSDPAAGLRAQWSPDPTMSNTPYFFSNDVTHPALIVNTDLLSEGVVVTDQEWIRLLAPSVEPLTASGPTFDVAQCSIGMVVNASNADGVLVESDDALRLELVDDGRVRCSFSNVVDTSLRPPPPVFYTSINQPRCLHVPNIAGAGASLVGTNPYFDLKSLFPRRSFAVVVRFRFDPQPHVGPRSVVGGLGFGDQGGLTLTEDRLQVIDASGNMLANVYDMIPQRSYHVVMTNEALYLDGRKYVYRIAPTWSVREELRIGNTLDGSAPWGGTIDECVITCVQLNFATVRTLFENVHTRIDSAVDVLHEPLTLLVGARWDAGTVVTQRPVPYRGNDGVLRAHYAFDDDTARDLSERDDASPLTLVNAQIRTVLREGTARGVVEFDGSQGYVECDSGSLSDLGTSTITAHVTLGSVAPSTRYPICAQEGRFALYLQSDASGDLHTKLFLSPEVTILVKDAKWLGDSVELQTLVRSPHYNVVVRPMLTTYPNPKVDELRAVEGGFSSSIVTAYEQTTVDDTLSQVVDSTGAYWHVSSVNEAHLHVLADITVYDLEGVNPSTVGADRLESFGEPSIALSPNMYSDQAVRRLFLSERFTLLQTMDGRWHGIGEDIALFSGDASMTSATTLYELTAYSTYSIDKLEAHGTALVFLTDSGALHGIGRQPVTHNLFGLSGARDLQTITPILPGTSVSDFSHHGSHAIVLAQDGTVLTAGSNFFGELGQGTTTSTSAFASITIPAPTQVVGVRTTQYASAYITSESRVFVCGYSYQNALNTGSDYTMATSVFTEIVTDFPIRNYFMTPGRTWLVSEDHTLYVCGPYGESYHGWPSGVFGGFGSTARPTPVDDSINDGEEVLEVIGDTPLFTIVRKSNAFFAFGSNMMGQLANGDRTTTTLDTRAYRVGAQDDARLVFVATSQTRTMVGYCSAQAIVDSLTPEDVMVDHRVARWGRVSDTLAPRTIRTSIEHLLHISLTPQSAVTANDEIANALRTLNPDAIWRWNLNNGDRVTCIAHAPEGAVRLFAPFDDNVYPETPWAAQAWFEGQPLFNRPMPNVGHRFSGAIVYELAGGESQSLESLRYRVRHYRGTGFYGDVHVFYRAASTGFEYHSTVSSEFPSADLDTKELQLSTPTPKSSAFLLVFVARYGGIWNEILRLQLRMFTLQPPPKEPPYVLIEDQRIEGTNLVIEGTVFSAHAAVVECRAIAASEELGVRVMDSAQLLELTRTHDSAIETSAHPAQYEVKPFQVSFANTGSLSGVHVRVVAVDADGRIGLNEDIAIPQSPIVRHSVDVLEIISARVVHPLTDNLYAETFQRGADLYVGLFGASGRVLDAHALPEVGVVRPDTLSFSRLQEGRFVLHAAGSTGSRLFVMSYALGRLSRIETPTVLDPDFHILGIMEQPDYVHGVFCVVSITGTLLKVYVVEHNALFNITAVKSRNMTYTYMSVMIRDLVYAGRRGYFWEGRVSYDPSTVYYAGMFAEVVEGQYMMRTYPSVGAHNYGWGENLEGGFIYLDTIRCLVIINRVMDGTYAKVYEVDNNMLLRNISRISTESILPWRGFASSRPIGQGYGIFPTNDPRVLVVLTSSGVLRKLRVHTDYRVTIANDGTVIHDALVPLVVSGNASVTINHDRTHLMISGYDKGGLEKVYGHVSLEEVPTPSE